MTRRNGSPSAPPARRPPRYRLASRILVALFLLACLPGKGLAGLAAPSAPPAASTARFDVPGWMSAQTAATLNLGFDVLVPADVPAPFQGEPAVEARDGYYQLYWLIPGAPPTYLLISGEVGGTIPAFSYYDRNVQLQVNADVQGTPAYHDLTPIYDRVYWQVGNVVYTVDSHNLASTDSLSLANSLSPLGAPPADTGGGTGNATGADNGTPSASATLDVPGTVQSGVVAAISVGGVANATLTADAGTFTANGDTTLGGVGSGSYNWQAPQTDTDQTVTFTLSDADSGATLATAQTVVQAAAPTQTSASAQASLRCPKLATASKTARFSLAGTGTLTVDASDGTFPAGSPNTEFAPDADGSNSMTGTLAKKSTISLAWLAPDTAMTAYLFVRDPDGNTLAECGIEVTYDEVATPTSTPKKSSGPPGDGTDLGNRLDAVVAQVLAYHGPPPAGDATGAPKPTVTAAATQPGPTATATSSPTPTRTPTPAATATATLAPVALLQGGVAQTIGPEGGELRCPSGDGVTLSIPAGSLKEPSWVTIRPVGAQELPASSAVNLVAGTAFDVTVALANGQSVDKLGAPATLSLTLPRNSANPHLILYRVAGTGLEPLSNVKVNGNTVSASLTKASRIVAGLPAPSAAASTSRDPKPFLLAAVGAVVTLAVIFALGSILLRRRPRTVTPRRVLPSRARVR